MDSPPCCLSTIKLALHRRGNNGLPTPAGALFFCAMGPWDSKGAARDFFGSNGFQRDLARDALARLRESLLSCYPRPGASPPIAMDAICAGASPPAFAACLEIGFLLPCSLSLDEAQSVLGKVGAQLDGRLAAWPGSWRLESSVHGSSLPGELHEIGRFNLTGKEAAISQAYAIYEKSALGAMVGEVQGPQAAPLSKPRL